MRTNLLILTLTASITLTGCIHKPASSLLHQQGESVVLIKTQPASLAYTPSATATITVRNTYLPSTNSITFQEGTDYLIDRPSATIRRTPHSRIPDFSTNSLYGQQHFDHSQFPGFGNTGFFAFIDYTYTTHSPWPNQPRQNHLLPHTFQKLETGAPLKVIAYGDSITAGGDATHPSLIFWQRWAESLQAKYPHSPITIINGATGGDSTRQGLERLDAKVLHQNPDLVLIGFGMNDHNIHGVPLPEFTHNLATIIERIRQETSAEVLLFSAFPPNDQWKFGSHQMQHYAQATANVAATLNCAYADVFHNWLQISDRKKPEDLLGNNINHPNDFGHWIYYQVLTKATCH
ncbi:MAG: SGNH/GDSL hydrolase family protein [Limisphaerales bacterium]